MKAVIKKPVSLAAGLLFGSALSLGAVGCQEKETLLDVETPGGQVEVEKNKDTGKVDVEVTDK